MNITIEQTLHGYETGHQLLMSSTPLSSDAKQTLLVQSDLSGSNIDENFKTYISGYPLNQYYAFSKTWYADEMRRPGCVWTQTFLISFVDLGKIADLSQLTSFFKRPVKDQYEEYSKPIVIERSELDRHISKITASEWMTKILIAVYDKPESTILIPASSSSQHESTILEIWSNQWPRLRRNFSFCTGALSLKTLGGKDFDVQVIPRRNVLSVETQTLKGFSIDTETIKPIMEDWVALLYKSNNLSLRRFLWIYGSDVTGNRKNYRPLILLYGESLNNGANFKTVSELLNYHFNSLDDARRLKTDIFTDNKIYKFNRRDILYYLFENNYDSKISEQFNLNQLLLEAYNGHEIDTNELVELYLKAPSELISDTLLDGINVNDDEILSMITKDARLIKRFGGRIAALGVNEQTWRRPFEFQVKLLRAIEEVQGVEWKDVINAILLTKSEIIFDALKQNYQHIFIALSWMDKHNYSVLRKLEDRIFIDYKRPFIDFVRNNASSIEFRTSEKIFQNLNFSEINSIGFDATKWLNVYRKISDENTRIFASCVLLSFGFNRKVSNAAALVVGCFSDVYYFAKAAKVSGNDWQTLPVDMSEEDDDDRTPLTLFFNFFNLFSPQKKDIPNWDYCELLIRTMVNKFMKHGWPNQAFLETLTTEHLTQQAIRYCLSFKKGVKFLKILLSDIEKGKVKLGRHQSNFISQISSRMIDY